MYLTEINGCVPVAAFRTTLHSFAANDNSYSEKNLDPLSDRMAWLIGSLDVVASCWFLFSRFD